MGGRQTPRRRQARTSPVAALLPVLFTLAWTSGVCAAESGYRLEVSPRICVRLGSEEPCEMALEVAWSGPPAGEICLRQRGAEKVLQCWRDASQGRVQLDFHAVGDLVLQLLKTSPETVLAEEEVKVLTRSLKDSRRRRRHVWSIL